jgi:hypothetical protein
MLPPSPPPPLPPLLQAREAAALAEARARSKVSLLDEKMSQAAGIKLKLLERCNMNVSCLRRCSVLRMLQGPRLPCRRPRCEAAATAAASGCLSMARVCVRAA